MTREEVASLLDEVKQQYQSYLEYKRASDIAMLNGEQGTQSADRAHYSGDQAKDGVMHGFLAPTSTRI